MNPEVLIPALFRKEFAKMVAILSRSFGLEHIEVAEDLASATFLLAQEKWTINGAPANPTAWLYRVAKQKALGYLRRKKIFEQKIAPAWKLTHADSVPSVHIDFSKEHIHDSQLRMLFAVCNPAIGSEAQIALALRVLCGFGIDEIAQAFLTNKETINKRLFRAKEKLRSEKITLETLSKEQLALRLDGVLYVLYLLFNEGYYSTTQNETLRKDLCMEALQLALILADNPHTSEPRTHALIALMFFHGSRFGARQTKDGAPILYDAQDQGLWDQEMIAKGAHFLGLSAMGSEISSYHLEAGIAFWHCQKEDTREKWESILLHYDALQKLTDSPIVALNRTYAVFRVRGRDVALSEAHKLGLTSNVFYFVLLGELYSDQDKEKSLVYFGRALDLAKTETDRSIISRRMKNLSSITGDL